MTPLADRLRTDGWAIAADVLRPDDVRFCRETLATRSLSGAEIAPIASHPQVTGVLDELCSSWFFASALSGVAGFTMGPTAAWHVDPPIAPMFPCSVPVSPRTAEVHAMFALDDFTERNGPTEVRTPNGRVVPAIMRAGSVFLFNASALEHRAAPRLTDEPRAFIVIAYRGELRTDTGTVG